MTGVQTCALPIFGPPGLGKTTLAQIVARELGVGFRATSGPVIAKAGDLAALLTADEPDGETFSMVPVPVAEPDIVPMLHHGARVDVVGQGPRVVASGGRVVTTGEGDAVLVLLRQDQAAAVAAASLSEPLTLVLSNRP